LEGEVAYSEPKFNKNDGVRRSNAKKGLALR